MFYLGTYFHSQGTSLVFSNLIKAFEMQLIGTYSKSIDLELSSKSGVVSIAVK